MRHGPAIHALLNFGPLEPLAKRIALLASLGLSLRVRGSRRVPRTGPLVVVSTHPGPVDLATLDAALGRPLDIVLNDLLLRVPLLGSLLRARGAHSVRRVALGADEGNAQSLAEAAAAARAGRAVVIFPEGTSHTFGSGAVRIAAAAQALVLPVTIYPMGGERAPLRRLVVAGHPLAPPKEDPRERRAFLRRLTRRHVLGEEMREPFAMALDDPHLWRRPSAAVRRSARLARLDGDAKRRFLRAARALRRGCAALRCSVGDLREPPGLRHALAYVALLPPAAIGVLLCAPPLLALQLAFRGQDRHFGRVHMGVALAGPYGLALLATGLALLGAPGLLLPAAALLGLCCAGFARSLRRRVLRIARVRREGPRLARLLAAFDRAIYADLLSAPFFARVA